MRVAIYARVSTANNGQDPTMQTRELLSSTASARVIGGTCRLSPTSTSASQARKRSARNRID